MAYGSRFKGLLLCRTHHVELGPDGRGDRTYVLTLRDMVTHIMYIVDYYLMLVRCGECGEYKPWIFPPFCRNPNL